MPPSGARSPQRLPAHVSVDPVVSKRMRAVRQTGTKPEVAVRGILRALGMRYRSQVKALPGSPDLANQRAGWALFVHGCFWHGHEGCRLYRLPKTNPDFWQAKVEANRARDLRKEEALRELGLKVVVVWQCELSDPARLRRRLLDELPR